MQPTNIVSHIGGRMPLLGSVVATTIILANHTPESNEGGGKWPSA